MLRDHISALHLSATPRYSFSCISCISCLFVVGNSSGSFTSVPALAAADAEQLTFFENDIRPLFVERCIKCHGPKKVRVRDCDSTRLPPHSTGGDSGPAVVPHQPDDSLIIKAVRHEDDLQMPPEEKLDDREIAALVRWIREGAAWPEGMMRLAALASKSVGGRSLMRNGRSGRFSPSLIPNLLRYSLRRYRRARSRTASTGLFSRSYVTTKLKPMRPANKRVLIRRATFDLTGLPPTPEDIEAFLDDDSPERVRQSRQSPDGIESIRRALGHDIGWTWFATAIRPGETADYPTPLSYKYRNWVINALNADKPYDQFVREQIAGDILANAHDRSFNRKPEACASPDGQRLLEARRLRLAVKRRIALVKLPRHADRHRLHRHLAAIWLRRRELSQPDDSRHDRYRRAGFSWAVVGLRSLSRSQVRSVEHRGLLRVVWHLREHALLLPWFRTEKAALRFISGAAAGGSRSESRPSSMPSSRASRHGSKSWRPSRPRWQVQRGWKGYVEARRLKLPD